MIGPSSSSGQRTDSDVTPYSKTYVWSVAVAAALGGLLFGYDWVVIGGAKPFYEAYFRLSSQQQVGWANSCALLGCLLGSMLAGWLSDAIGRKRSLLISAFLFTVSSALTGWAFTFQAFVFWRIVGGLAIGLASNISPTYIAEMSPAPWRGRLVSLNQLSIVLGILLAQIADWLIAARVPENVTRAFLAVSWNGQYGWRWMFTATCLPAIIFLAVSFFIPESPRWLAAKGRHAEAARVLGRVGGEAYAVLELSTIELALRGENHKRPKLGELLQSRYRRILLIGIGLAVLQQWSGINVLFNYAEEVYRSAGYGVSGVLFNIIVTGSINLIFSVLAMGLIDRIGRRFLLIFGCVGVGLAQLLAGFAYRSHMQGAPVLLLTLGAIACYAVSLAPVAWVLIAEIFPNHLRGAGVGASVSALWASSFALTYTFPLLSASIGISGTFFLYGGICLAGAICAVWGVPETKGKTLEQIEAELT